MSDEYYEQIDDVFEKGIDRIEKINGKKLDMVDIIEFGWIIMNAGCCSENLEKN